MNEERLNVLLVSYAFPPVGGAGVQRPVKLAKYLPEHGIDVSVLTVKNPSVPLQDGTFDEDLRGVTVHRARTLEPGYGVKRAGLESEASEGGPSLRSRAMRFGLQLARQLLVPDPQVLWLPGAAMELAKRVADYDVIVITGPPFSQFLLGPLTWLHGRALVLDYRDEWSTLRESYENLQGWLGRFLGGPLERALARSANAVVVATPAFREHLMGRFPFLDADRVHAISNGFDSDDFPDELPPPSGDKLRLTYAGTVYRLTSPSGLLSAVRKLHERRPSLARHLEVKFIGRVVPAEESAFEGMEELGVERLGYIPHGELMGHLSSSHYVCCIQSDDPGVERIYPGKIFELMKVGRPVLTLSPEGALTELVEEHELGPHFEPNDTEAIVDFLVGALEHFVETGRVPASDIDEARIARFDRRELAGRWAEVLRTAVADAHRANAPVGRPRPLPSLV